MSLALPEVRRLGRQIALPAIGLDGQERISAAEVALVGDGGDLAIETARLYLAGAGVRRFRAAAGGADGAAWVEALRGASVVVRSAFDDDPMLRAAVRLGVPVVVVRAREDAVDLIAFRRHGPRADVDLDVPARRADERPQGGAAAVVAGTLAAAEALWILARPDEGPAARHLRLALAGDDEPLAQEIPWTP